MLILICPGEPTPSFDDVGTRKGYEARLTKCSRERCFSFIAFTD